MASIRTIKIRSASLKWYTGKLSDLVYSHDKIKDTYLTLVKPGLKGITSMHDIKLRVCDLLEELINSGKVSTMNDWVNIVMALRLTEINETELEDDGSFKVRMIVPCPKMEKATYWNIAWHMNHHCKQLYKCCFVQAVYRYGFACKYVAVSYTSGEAYDREDYFLDNYYEKNRNSSANYYKNRKRGE